MTIHLLLDHRMGKIPDAIKLVQNFGELSIHVEGNSFDVPCRGKHVLLHGEESAFQNWLRPLDGFWLGKGQPMLQDFTIAHIKD